MSYPVDPEKFPALAAWQRGDKIEALRLGQLQAAHRARLLRIANRIAVFATWHEHDLDAFDVGDYEQPLTIVVDIVDGDPVPHPGAYRAAAVEARLVCWSCYYEHPSGRYQGGEPATVAMARGRTEAQAIARLYRVVRYGDDGRASW